MSSLPVSFLSMMLSLLVIGEDRRQWRPGPRRRRRRISMGVPSRLGYVEVTRAKVGRERTGHIAGVMGGGGGLPIYTFAKDGAPGETKGQLVKGMWHIVTPSRPKGRLSRGEPGHPVPCAPPRRPTAFRGR
jgi:hypothetical protein